MRRRYRAIGKPTKAQQAYQDRQRAGGCAYCHMLGFSFRGLQEGMSPCGATTIHHRTIGDIHGQKQIGHDDTIALGEWHHQGTLKYEFPTRALMREKYGPSLHHSKRAFLDVIADNLVERSTEVLQRWMDEQLQGRNAA